MTVNWDEFKDESTYVKFETPGDTIYGTITDVRPGTDYNGKPCPELELATDESPDEPRILSCGQANLKHQIVELKPSVGDVIRVTYTHGERAALGTRKMFKIEHTPLGATQVPSEEPPF